MSYATNSEVEQAAELLRSGGVVAFPTETVYGLGADARNPAAVLKIFAAKGRPTFHPLIVHIADAALLAEWCTAAPPAAELLAERFWPGPLTLILNRKRDVPDVVTGGLPTIGVRVPAHPLAQTLLREFGGGLAAPSANRFGHVSPTTAQHVRDELGDRIDAVLDGGPCAIGLESTIVDLTGSRPAILRPGAVTLEQLRETVPDIAAEAPGDAPHCSGRLLSHYAPQAQVELLPAAELASRLQSTRPVAVAILSCDPPPVGPQQVWIPMPSDLSQYAQRLYAALREVDDRALARALVVMPPTTGVGAAIVDRLRKAAAPRDG